MSDNNARASYGKACINCAKAKCKCVLRAEGPCERCHRLSKSCHAASSRRARSRRGGDSNKRLEEKLDDLVALLRRPTPSNGVSEHADSRTDGRSDENGSPGATGASTDSPNRPAALSNNSGLPACPELSASALGDAHQAAEADLILKVFRNRHLMHLPIIHIPIDAKADDLRQRRPFFWKNVEFVTETRFERQQTIGRSIRATLAQKLIVEHDRSVDLLMGLITYITWGTAQIQAGDGPYVSLYCHMLVALVQDLGLNRNPQQLLPIQRWNSNYMNAASRFSRYSPSSSRNPSRTLEQRRFVLAAFMLTSAAPSFIQKIDSLTWNNYMEECLEVVDNAHECENDTVLVALVRLQLIAETATQSQRPGDHNAMTGSLSTSGRTVGEKAAIMLVKILQARVHSLLESLSPEVASHPLVAGHRYAVELSILEVLLPGHDQPKSPSMAEFERLGVFCSLLSTAKSWFEHFFSMPNDVVASFPMLIVAHLSHFSLVLYHISTLNDPAWNAEAVSHELDVVETMRRAAAKLETIPEYLGLPKESPDNQNHICARAAKVFYNNGRCWESELKDRDGDYWQNGAGEGPAFLPNVQNAFNIYEGGMGFDFTESMWDPIFPVDAATLH